MTFSIYLRILLLVILGLSQIVAGYLGIEYFMGKGWAIFFIIFFFVFRFTLPITIGAFFGATNVWGWHWFLAFLFSAPGLIFMFFFFAKNFGKKSQ